MKKIFKLLKKNLDKTNNFFLGTIILFLLIVNLVFTFFLNSLYNVFPSGDWLGFFGGILGAILGLSGIYWQFERQKKEEERKKKLASLNFTIFELKNINSFFDDMEVILFNSIMFYKLPYYNENKFRKEYFNDQSKNFFNLSLEKLMDEGEIFNEYYKFIKFLYKFEDIIYQNYENKPYARKAIIDLEDILLKFEGSNNKQHVTADMILKYNKNDLKEFQLFVNLLDGDCYIQGEKEYISTLEGVNHFRKNIISTKELFKAFVEYKSKLHELIQNLENKLEKLTPKQKG